MTWLITTVYAQHIQCNSASDMFAVLHIPLFGELLRKFAFSLMTIISPSLNLFMVNIYSSSVPMFYIKYGVGGLAF